MARVMSIDERTAAGADFIQKKLGAEGIARLANFEPNQLHVEFGNTCALAVAFGGQFIVAAKELGIEEDEQAAALGFYPVAAVSDFALAKILGLDNRSRELKMLDASWRRRIAELRKQNISSQPKAA